MQFTQANSNLSSLRKALVGLIYGFFKTITDCIFIFNIVLYKKEPKAEKPVIHETDIPLNFLGSAAKDNVESVVTFCFTFNKIFKNHGRVKINLRSRQVFWHSRKQFLPIFISVYHKHSSFAKSRKLIGHQNFVA